MKFLAFSQTKKLESSLALPPPSLKLRRTGVNGLGGFRLRIATDGQGQPLFWLRILLCEIQNLKTKKNIQTSSKKHNMVVICSTCAFGSGTLPTRICLAESSFRFVV
ncbi:hypothetical protein KKD57_07025 [Patescibacteria group bacterium]|nr:hypothetical protein [Patescibacteria group bacterium]